MCSLREHKKPNTLVLEKKGNIVKGHVVKSSLLYLRKPGREDGNRQLALELKGQMAFVLDLGYSCHFLGASQLSQ